MRRILWMAVALTLATPAARAQLVEDALLGSVNLAYVSATSEQTGGNTDGVGLNLGIERMVGGSPGVDGLRSHLLPDRRELHGGG